MKKSNNNRPRSGAHGWGAAHELKETPDPNDQALSGEIKRFVSAMPKIDTERHETKARLIGRFSIQREEETQAIPGAAHKTGIEAKPNAAAVQIGTTTKHQEEQSEDLER